jgi:membrane protein required for colicin V production
MIFDAVVYLVVAFAAVTGFKAGFLRSFATIIGYLSAMPIAVAATRLLSGAVAGKYGTPLAQNSILFGVLFVGAGIVLGGLLRFGVNELVGPSVSIPDRLAGSTFGAARIILVAVTIVLVFDQLIPSSKQPAFLDGSQLRPLLSVVGQRGIKSLPVDVAAYIDQLRRGQRL